ncbi:MAG: GumC family protein [Acidobacteriota bacterium]
MSEESREGPDFRRVEGEEVSGELDLGGYLQLLVEYRWWILGVTLAATLGGLLYAFLATPVYTASATLFIDRGSQKTSTKELGNVVSSDLTTELFFNSQVDLMKSKEVAQGAFEALGLEHHPAFAGAERPLEEFRKCISVQRKRDSALFTLSVSAPYQRDVALWANALADSYNQVTLRQKMQILREADRLMADQAAKMEKEYERLKHLYGDQLRATGSYFPENQKEILDKRIEALELRLNDVGVREGEVSAIVAQISAIREGGGDPVSLPSSSQDPSLQDMTRTYNDMVRDLSRLQVKYTPKHPEVLSLLSRIARQGDAILATYRHQLAALRSEKGTLTSELARLKAEAIAATQQSGQSESLEAGVEAVRKYMELLVEKMREVDLASNLLSNAVQVVDRADAPSQPSKPKKKMAVLLAFLFGLMGSVGFVLLLQAVDRRIKDPDVLEKRLGLPLFGVIPLSTSDTRAFAAEAFLNLRTSLLYASNHKAKRIWMVTSPSAAEGKSTIAANVAITLTSSGDKVLLVDCDLRKPSLHSFFKKDRQPGLAEYLSAEEESIEGYCAPAGKPGLWLMTAGKTPANPPILLDTDKFRRFLESARTRFEWVILDTPPVLAVTDPLVLAAHVEGILTVVRYRSTPVPLLERLLMEFGRIEKPVDGAILNQFEWARHYYYNSYYYKHYRYYYGKEAPAGFWQKVVRAAGFKKRKAAAAGSVLL